MKLTYKKIEDFAEVIAGQSPPSNYYNKGGDGLPFFQGKADFEDKYPEARNWCTSPKGKIANVNDILISVRAPVGPVNLCNVKSIIGRGLSAIRVRSGYSYEYLYYYLKRNENKISKIGTGSIFKAITQKQINNIRVPIPENYDDQIRIAKILSCAETIITKRKESISLLDELLKSIFLKMFGDPVRNEMQWQKIPLGELLGSLKYGTNTKAIEYQKTGNEMPVLRIPNIVGGRINYSDLKYVSVNEREALQLTLNTGDILFVRSNGNPNYIGRCAFFNDNFVNNNKFIYASYLIRARIKRPYRIIPEIIATIINSDSFRKVIVKEAKTTAGNYNINMEGLSKLRIINPDLEKQEKYLLLKDKVESVRSKYELLLREYEKLYSALCRRAFRGELDLSRIPVDDDIKPDPAKQKSEGRTPEVLTNKQFTSNELVRIIETKPGRQIISGELWGGLEQGSFEEPPKHDEVRDMVFDMMDVGKFKFE